MAVGSGAARGRGGGPRGGGRPGRGDTWVARPPGVHRLGHAAVDAVEAAHGRAETIVASGGALHASPAFVRIVERALGRPLALRPDADDTARGAALIAWERIRAAP